MSIHTSLQGPNSVTSNSTAHSKKNMKKQAAEISIPEILAPAGNKASFLAAVAAQADAIYCGLKLFSARMEAKNFTLEESTALVRLAHKKGIKVFVTINSLLKPSDLPEAGKMLIQLQRRVKPDGVIIQDLALVPLVQQTGFSGEIHLSTLANAGFAKALQVIRQKLRINRVVLPRELNIDELKTMARACPDGLGLEVFVHGALCYSVSGRCYWSSFLGGKSSLRGRCVQPCRRQYSQAGRTHRYFSCQDLSVDVLVKLLLSIPQVRTWKIEGRKKGPHYVYHTVCGYRMLRDHGRDPKMKKEALRLLEYGLGRSSTHYFFLPQRPRNPVDLQSQTGSGMLIGRIKGSQQKPFFNTREELLPGDVLRMGYEDQPGHAIKRIARAVPRGGRMHVNPSAAGRLAKGAPVFLTDRREESLNKMIGELQDQLDQIPAAGGREPAFKPGVPKTSSKKNRVLDFPVYRSWLKSIPRGPCGLWLSGQNIQNVPGNITSKIRWWLPPVVWPESETQISDQLRAVIQKGARYFVLNAPWQIGFFASPKKFNLWAGPFCNLANPLAIATIAKMGFNGAFVSPELGADDFLQLPQQTTIPLGVVIQGNWPLCVARSNTDGMQLNRPFSSPRGEQAWVTRYESDYWTYPNWKLDLQQQKKALQKAGYSLFADLIEPVPAKVKIKKRPGVWNWKHSLK